MSQQDEYELYRGDKWYQLDVTYEFKAFPVDDEGCPVMTEEERHGPMVDVLRAEVLAEGETSADGTDTALVEYAGPDYPTLELTAEEVREFDEFLCDRACPDE